MTSSELDKFIADAEAKKLQAAKEMADAMRRKAEYEERNKYSSHIEDFMTPEE